MEQKTTNRTERGATLVEYAMLVALLVTTSLVAIDFLTDASGEVLTSTGEEVGEPRERIADIEPTRPEPPAWLP